MHIYDRLYIASARSGAYIIIISGHAFGIYMYILAWARYHDQYIQYYNYNAAVRGKYVREAYGMVYM